MRWRFYSLKRLPGLSSSRQQHWSKECQPIRLHSSTSQLHRAWSVWSEKPGNPLSKAAAVATETQQETFPDVEAKNLAGVFQRIPQVPSSESHLKSALRKANRLQGNKKIKGKLQHARNLSARKLDALTKEIAVPLGAISKGFPACSRMHPFEQALLDLTIGSGIYEKRLQQLDNLRKSCLQVGKSFAGKANKGVTVAEVNKTLEEGFQSLEALYQKGSGAVESVKFIAITLRKLPTVDIGTPTIALVGAPNVGKSSLVQLLSSGLPEICNYPFTTRTVKMGHFYVDGRRHQVTDTPGLLNRQDGDRNKMELLTLACLQHLPSAVVFVMDLTGDCGTKPVDQWRIRESLRNQFSDKAWMDVFSKSDLLQQIFEEADHHLTNADKNLETKEAPSEASKLAASLPQAVRVSSTEQLGIETLKQYVLKLL